MEAFVYELLIRMHNKSHYIEVVSGRLGFR